MIEDIRTRISSRIQEIQNNIGKVFVGKETIIRLLVTGLVSGLHVLIEDVPGVGKTTLARALSASLGLDFCRIQFTPDLLPGDIIGMSVWHSTKSEFLFKEGAIMHQFVLADEINRASPRTQSSLLEALQEESVTIDGETYSLPQPFFVVATQNPSSFTGSFQLPEGELDRFGISFSIGYPSAEDEKEILQRFREENPLEILEPVIGPEEVQTVRTSVRGIFLADEVQEFIIEIVEKTRTHNAVQLGASPRASQHLQRAAQGRALVEGREFVIPEDVIAIAAPVLAHRLILNAEAKMANLNAPEVVGEILKECNVPIGI